MKIISREQITAALSQLSCKLETTTTRQLEYDVTLKETAPVNIFFSVLETNKVLDKDTAVEPRRSHYFRHLSP